MRSLTTGLTLAVALFSSSVLADGRAIYEVIITNITKGQTFTPQLVVTHRSAIRLFELGEPASEPLGILAEAGDTGPITSVLVGAGSLVKDVTTIDGLVGPGESARTLIRAPRHNGRLSVAAMMIPTNDTFVALDTARLPRWGKAVYFARAYDAGTEANDQSCANMPGPRCGGEAVSEPADSDEGFVYVSNGFHELGSVDDADHEVLGPHTYDWRNPVARVQVRRVR